MNEQEPRKETSEANPLVSIAIPCYNHEKYIIECLNSVYHIDYSPIELLVIDDGSTDSSYELAQDWINLHQDRFSNIVIEKQKNQGICKTFNRLNTLAKGEYIAWLASDDQRTKSSIKDSLACLLTTGKSFLFSDAELIDENGLLIANSAFAYFNKNKSALKNINYLKMDVLLRWNPPFQILFMKKEAFIALGGLDETLPFEDLALMLRLLTTNDVAVCEHVTWRYRIRLNARLTPGVSLKKMHAGILKVYRKNANDFCGIPFAVLKLKILQLDEKTSFVTKKFANLTIRMFGYLHRFRTTFL